MLLTMTVTSHGSSLASSWFPISETTLSSIILSAVWIRAPPFPSPTLPTADDLFEALELFRWAVSGKMAPS